jgi:hypothetical protein
MKKTLIIALVTLSVLSCKSQIVPIEDVMYYKQNEIDLPDNTTYVKDVNHLLDKFAGTWIGTYDNRDYELVITAFTKYDDYYDEISRDILKMRYKITDNSLGQEVTIIDTTSLPNDNYLVNTGYLLESINKYRFIYVGENANCGQSGDIIIETINSSDTQIRLLLLLDFDIAMPEYDCPDEIEQLFPTRTNMILEKQ